MENDQYKRERDIDILRQGLIENPELQEDNPAGGQARKL